MGKYVGSPNSWGFDSENLKTLLIYSLCNVKKNYTFLQLSATSYLSCLKSECIYKGNNAFVTTEKPYHAKKARLILEHYSKYFGKFSNYLVVLLLFWKKHRRKTITIWFCYKTFLNLLMILNVKGEITKFKLWWGGNELFLAKF